MGTALSTFTCEDPDSPGAPLAYQLQTHSPPGLASLRLRDRVLEVPAGLPGPRAGSWEGGKDMGGAYLPGSLERAGQGIGCPGEAAQCPSSHLPLPLSAPGQVNATLDCDSPGACPQLTASLLVLDGGQPPMSSE